MLSEDADVDYNTVDDDGNIISPPVPPASLSSLLFYRAGRGLTDLRPSLLTLGIVDGVDGSALFNVGKTKVVASVRGPRPQRHIRSPEVDSAQLRVDVRFATPPLSASAPHTNNEVATERALAARIGDALAPMICLWRYPHCVIDVDVVVIVDDGNVWAAAVTAAAVALADADIECRDLVTAVTAHIAANDQHDGADAFVVLVDCDALEQRSPSITASVTIAFAVNSERPTAIRTDGRISECQAKTVDTAIEAAIAAARQSNKMIRTRLRESYQHKIDTNAVANRLPILHNSYDTHNMLR